MKKYFAPLLALLVLISFSTSAEAATSPEIKPDRDSIKYGDSLQYEIFLTGAIEELIGTQIKIRIVNMDAGTASDWSPVTLESSTTKATIDIVGHPFDKKGTYKLQVYYDGPTRGGWGSFEFQLLNDADPETLQGKPHLLSPRQQHTADISEIKCKEGLELVTKYDYWQACVKPSTKDKLIQMGWAKTGLAKNFEQPKIGTFDCTVIESGALLNACDLHGKELTGRDLSFASLRDSDLTSMNLREINLVKADLRHADLSGADLRGADLSLADLRSANLTGANLSGADLTSADLRHAILEGATLEKAILVTANLVGAEISGANLDEALLERATFASAVLVKASLRDALLNDAVLHYADLTDADLNDAILVRADLKEANLAKADLSDANLRDANLAGANLSGTHGRCLEHPICETLPLN